MELCQRQDILPFVASSLSGSLPGHPGRNFCSPYCFYKALVPNTLFSLLGLLQKNGNIREHKNERGISVMYSQLRIKNPAVPFPRRNEHGDFVATTLATLAPRIKNFFNSRFTVFENSDLHRSLVGVGMTLPLFLKFKHLRKVTSWACWEMLPSVIICDCSREAFRMGLL